MNIMPGLEETSTQHKTATPLFTLPRMTRDTMNAPIGNNISKLTYLIYIKENTSSLPIFLQHKQEKKDEQK